MLRILYYPISKRKLALFGSDAILFWACFFTAATLRHNLSWALTFLTASIFAISLICMIYLTVFYIGELYELKKDSLSHKVVLNIVLVCGVAFVASTVVIYPNYSLRLSRMVFIYHGLFVTVAMLASRFVLSAYQRKEGTRKKTLILGTSEFARLIVGEARKPIHTEMHVVALYEPSFNGRPEEVEGLPVILAQDAKLAEVVVRYGFERIILAIPLGSFDPLLRECFRLSHEGVEVIRGEDWFEQQTGKVPLRFIDDGWLLSAEVNRPKFYYRKVKRLMDLVLSVVGIFLGLPIMAAVAAAIYLESGRPVLFIQERTGRGGRPFRMYKYRTMVADAEPQGQAQWAEPGDTRLTRVGRIIRTLRLDEMPQLFNVWKGEMSIIGPRPEREVYIKEFLNPKPIEIKGRRREDAGRNVLLTHLQEALPYYSKRLLVQPGITGWAQVNYQYAGSFDETEIKLMYDLYYLKNLSFPLDCLILLRTIRVVLFGKGAR